MEHRLEADPFNPGAFRVLAGDHAQSWVDPADPLRLEFEYVQRISEVLDATILTASDDQRLRVVHLGGGGLSLPRWVAARRPHTAQIVCEPDAALTEQVRRILPLPPRSGIKVRDVDGRAGIVAMPHDYADAVVLDAFDGLQVPADLATEEFLDEVVLRRRPGGIVVANVTARAPFGWSRQFTAGVADRFRSVLVSAEAAVWKGRRMGNLVVAASGRSLPVPQLTRVAAAAPFPYQLKSGRELERWLGGASGLRDADATPSPGRAKVRGWFE